MSTFETGLTSDISVARLGKPGGFAPLGLDSKVPSINLPTGLAGGLALQGGYDASTNTPDLTAGAQQTDGALYIVTVEGTQDIGNGSELFTVGDAVFYSSGDARWFLLQGSTLALEVSYDNGSSGLVAVNLQEAIDELAAGGANTAASVSYNNGATLIPSTNVQDALDYVITNESQRRFVQERTLTFNETLLAAAPTLQHVLTNTPGLELALPASPTNGLRFLIKNDEASTESFTVTGGPSNVTLPPGDLYEAVYGVTKWMVI